MPITKFNLKWHIVMVEKHGAEPKAWRRFIARCKRNYIRSHAINADTPAPWDMDEDTAKWCVEWGEESQNAIYEDHEGFFNVCFNWGENVHSYGGLVEALQAARETFKTMEA